MAAGLEPPLPVWPSALQPLERIPRVWERKLVLSCSKRAAEEAEGAVLPAWVKGSLTGLLSIHPKPLSTREDRSAHHLHSSPNILPGLWTDAPRRKPSPYLISPVLPSEFVKVTSKQLSPGPRGPGVSPWYLPVPGQPCQVEGAGLLGSRPPKPRGPVCDSRLERCPSPPSVPTWACGAKLASTRAKGVPEPFLPACLPGRTQGCS